MLGGRLAAPGRKHVGGRRHRRLRVALLARSTSPPSPTQSSSMGPRSPVSSCFHYPIIDPLPWACLIRACFYRCSGWCSTSRRSTRRRRSSTSARSSSRPSTSAATRSRAACGITTQRSSSISVLLIRVVLSDLRLARYVVPLIQKTCVLNFDPC
jgi:hypothetical protein